MKNKLIYILAVLAASLFILNAAAADYSFKVPNASTYVMLEPDGSMTINVEYTFENLGQELDYIDIGLPNNNYTDSWRTAYRCRYRIRNSPSPYPWCYSRDYYRSGGRSYC